MDAVIIDLPVRHPICDDCENGYLGRDGVYCRVYAEVIFDETFAAECNEYTP